MSRISLGLDELADFQLPTGRRVSQREAYYQLFSWKSSFTRAVQTLQRLGRLPRRPDDSFRVWDLYAVIREVGWFTRFAPEGDRHLGSTTNRFPRLHWLKNIEEPYWERAERMRHIHDDLRAARYLRSVRDPRTGRRRDETAAEFRRRYGRTSSGKRRFAESLALALPNAPEYWRSQLRIHASTAMELREFGFGNASRLCARQLAAATALAEIRLGQTYRQVRALVGTVNPNLEIPALSAASFSPEHQGFDLTLDAVDAALPLYNERMPKELRSTSDQGESLLEFLDSTGLQEWFVEFSVVSWSGESFWASGLDRRISLGIARVRTLTVLLEEAMSSLAERTGLPGFREGVESAAGLYQRLNVFFNFPRISAAVFDWAAFQRIYERWGRAPTTPPVDAARLAASLTALGLTRGEAPSPPVRETAERTVAALVLIRNIASHRFPVLREGDRPAWFKEWGERLPSINRTVLWSAMMLWAVSEYVRQRARL